MTDYETPRKGEVLPFVPTGMGLEGMLMLISKIEERQWIISLTWYIKKKTHIKGTEA